MWDAVWNRAFLDPLLRGRYPDRVAAFFEKLERPGDLAEIRRPVDFIGINYYSRMYQRSDPHGQVGTNWGGLPPGTPTTGMGWAIEPDGLLELLVQLRDGYGNPRVYVTENGAAYDETPGPDGRVEDRGRIAYLRDHIAVCHRALADKCNLGGYFVWTLIDNFEWTHGFTRRFGLVRLDPSTLRRIPKASYGWYSRVAHGNALT
jgi:beta-glucosidase